MGGIKLKTLVAYFFKIVIYTELYEYHLKEYVKAGEMADPVKAPTAKPYVLSLIPGCTHSRRN